MLEAAVERQAQVRSGRHRQPDVEGAGQHGDEPSFHGEVGDAEGVSREPDDQVGLDQHGGAQLALSEEADLSCLRQPQGSRRGIGPPSSMARRRHDPKVLWASMVAAEDPAASCGDRGDPTDTPPDHAGDERLGPR